MANDQQHDAHVEEMRHAQQDSLWRATHGDEPDTEHVCDESRSNGRCDCPTTGCLHCGSEDHDVPDCPVAHPVYLVTPPDGCLPCGHPLSAALPDELANTTHEPERYCGVCELIDLADEVRVAIAAGDEMWAGTMAERAVGVARKMGRVS